MADTLSFNLSLQRGGFTLQGVADIPLHGITGIAGPSGSGKTTLLRALAGLEPNAIGTVKFGTEDWSNRPAKDRDVGFVFQDMRLFRHLDVAGNLSYGAKRRQAPSGSLSDVIDALDLAPLLTRNVASLSGGEARRVALGRALASAPKVLFLDEPMVGLDTNRRAEILPYITRAVDGFGLSVLYVSHSQFEMNLLADRILPIHAGQIGQLQTGPPRFELPIVATSDGQITFAVQEHRFSLSGNGTVGDNWELRLGNGCVLVNDHPGENSALAVLPITFCAFDPATAKAVIEIAGTQLEIACNHPFKTGASLWLICPGIRARKR